MTDDRDLAPAPAPRAVVTVDTGGGATAGAIGGGAAGGAIGGGAIGGGAIGGGATSGGATSGGAAGGGAADGGATGGRAAGGGADRPAFVLVHGIGVSSRYFERLVPALAEEGRVVAVDLPGFGKAKPERPARPLSIDDFARAVAAAMDRLGIADAVIVGHSMGTQIAVRLSGLRPDLVRALALLGPVMAPQDRNAVKAGVLLGIDTLREDARGNRLVIGDYLHCGPAWYLATLPAMLEYRIEDEIERAGVPVVVVRGGRDPIARDEWVDRLAERSGGTGVRVPGVAHLVMHGAPWRTAAVIAQAARARR